jgi:hypothetical protein
MPGFYARGPGGITTSLRGYASFSQDGVPTLGMRASRPPVWPARVVCGRDVRVPGVPFVAATMCVGQGQEGLATVFALCE